MRSGSPVFVQSLGVPGEDRRTDATRRMKLTYERLLGILGSPPVPRRKVNIDLRISKREDYSALLEGEAASSPGIRESGQLHLSTKGREELVGRSPPKRKMNSTFFFFLFLFLYARDRKSEASTQVAGVPIGH